VESPGWYTVTAVAIFLMGLFYEWLITFRQGTVLSSLSLSLHPALVT
jgi:hypothetical protein